MDQITGIGRIGGLEEIPRAAEIEKRRTDFAEILGKAIHEVDALQKESEAAQAGYAAGDPVDLHDVLIKIEEAEIAFKTMMEVRNKLVDAYREVMRIA